jgi:riboflavin transporter
MDYRYIYRLSSLQDYALGSIYQNIEMVVYSAVCFFVPFFLGHPQLLVGAAVNAALIAAALNLKGYRLLPVIMIPSLGVLTKGIIFGPLSIFLIYFIPFIWIGNTILVMSFKYFRLHKKHDYMTTLLIGALLKSGFLFMSALVLVKLGAVPAMFLTAMGAIQLTTALLGGAAAYGLHYGKKSVSK